MCFASTFEKYVLKTFDISAQECATLSVKFFAKLQNLTDDARWGKIDFY